jgi:hypothetical protein
MYWRGLEFYYWHAAERLGTLLSISIQHPTASTWMRIAAPIDTRAGGVLLREAPRCPVRRACLSTSGERVLCVERAVVGVQRGSRIPVGGGRQGCERARRGTGGRPLIC